MLKENNVFKEKKIFFNKYYHTILTIFIFLSIIIISPIVSSEVLCAENLTNDFNCSYDGIPIMQKKMNVICNLPNANYIIYGDYLFENDFKCVINILQNSTLLASNPEYKTSTFFSKSEDTRLSFQTTSGIMNGYYTTKNLRTDTPFTLQILCSNYTTTLKSEYCITPTYIKPDWILNVMIWAKDNAAFLIIIFLLFTVLMGIGIYYMKRL